MSRAASPSTGTVYGVARVLGEWEMARSSSYYQRSLVGQACRVLQRRGPKTPWSDATLTEKIREVLAASPFHGEGHRKVRHGCGLRGYEPPRSSSAWATSRPSRPGSNSLRKELLHE